MSDGKSGEKRDESTNEQHGKEGQKAAEGKYAKGSEN